MSAAVYLRPLAVCCSKEACYIRLSSFHRPTVVGAESGLPHLGFLNHFGNRPRRPVTLDCGSIVCSLGGPCENIAREFFSRPRNAEKTVIMGCPFRNYGALASVLEAIVAVKRNARNLIFKKYKKRNRHTWRPADRCVRMLRMDSKPVGYDCCHFVLLC